MLLVIFFLICFFASIIGAICGIGGGVIIKPVLDAFGVMDVATISFLSGCTVLSMTTYSVIKSKLSGNSNIDQKTGLPLALGAAVGGLLGKWMFSFVSSLNLMACVAIGIFLGILSSFLGIGGGPINLVVLFFFFSMTTKIAAENSLYIIFFSQIASLLSSIVTKSVPEFEIATLIFMVIGGIGGGIAGRALNKKIEEKTVDKLFIGLMVVIIFINIYNIYQFIG